MNRIPSKDEIEACAACDYCAHCVPVPYLRPDPAFEPAVLVVGRNPGAQEIEDGEPFVGVAGRRLDQALEEADCPRHLWWIDNVCKCVASREDVNVPPATDNAKLCASLWLQPLLTHLKPHLIVIAGRFAEKCFDDRWVTVPEETRLFPIVHPSAARRQPIYEARLRTQTRQLKRMFKRL